jgi:hypothetical protein
MAVGAVERGRLLFRPLIKKVAFIHTQLSLASCQSPAHTAIMSQDEGRILGHGTEEKS